MSRSVPESPAASRRFHSGLEIEFLKPTMNFRYGPGYRGDEMATALELCGSVSDFNEQQFVMRASRRKRRRN